MAALVEFADVETLTKQWLMTTAIPALVTRAVDGGVSIYLAMPPAAPVPAVVLTRLGGGPRRYKELPEDQARISFSCWGTSRAQAGTIVRTLVAELESLGRNGGYVSGDARLADAEVVRVFWLPDPESDTPRYIADALILAVSA